MKFTQTKGLAQAFPMVSFTLFAAYHGFLLRLHPGVAGTRIIESHDGQANVDETKGEFAIGGDMRVVRLGYGTMQIPGPGVWGPPRDHDEVIRVLRRAVELGVTFIDTADSYGPE